MEEDEAIYSTTFGTYNQISIWFIRFVLMILIGLVLFNVMKNPQGLVVVIGILFFVLFIQRSDKVVLYADRIVIIRYFFLDLIPYKTRIDIRDIVEMRILGRRDNTENIVLALVKGYFRRESKNEIYFIFKDEDTKNFKTRTDYPSLRELMTRFDALPSRNIHEPKS